MNEEALARRIIHVMAIGQRKTGIPKAEFGKDARILGVRTWWSTTVSREL
jgi:hypothetical protein